MTAGTHSRIILDEHSVNVVLKRILGKGSPVKSFGVKHRDDRLHLTIQVDYDHLDGVIDVPFFGRVHLLQQLLGNPVEVDLRVSVTGHLLRANLDFHGLASVVQQVLHFTGLASIFFFFAPHLRQVGPLKIQGSYELDYDLSSVRVPDGGDMSLTDLVKFHSISVGRSQDKMLNVEFSINEKESKKHVKNTTEKW